MSCPHCVICLPRKLLYLEGEEHHQHETLQNQVHFIICRVFSITCTLKTYVRYIRNVLCIILPFTLYFYTFLAALNIFLKGCVFFFIS